MLRILLLLLISSVASAQVYQENNQRLSLRGIIAREGMRPPKGDTNALPSLLNYTGDSALGALMYDTLQDKFCYWEGARWICLSDFTAGGDTTIFEVVVDSTGQPQRRLLFSGGNFKITSSPRLLVDSLNSKIVINGANVSVGGPNTKLWVQGNANVTGTFTVGSLAAVTDTTTYKPWVSGSDGVAKRFSYWPGGGGGGGVTGSGTATRAAFWSGTSTLSSDAAFYWDNTNKRLGIGTTTPTEQIEINGTGNRGFSVKSTSAANEAYFVLRNDINANIAAEVWGSNWADAALRNNGGFSSVNSMFFIANNTVASGGSGAISFRAGGSNSAQQRFTINNSGAFVEGSNQLQIGTTSKYFQQYTSSASNDAVKLFNSGPGSTFGLQNNNSLGVSGIDFLNNSGALKAIIGHNNVIPGQLMFSLSSDGSYVFLINLVDALRIFNSRSISINSASEVASSQLTVESTTRGFLPPRMTSTQRNAIGTPAAGLSVYNTTDATNDVYTTAWYNQPNGLKASATLDFASTNAQLSADLTITVTGAAVGDIVLLGTPVQAANSTFTAFVSAANTVTVRFNNYSAGAIDPASGTYKVYVIKN